MLKETSTRSEIITYVSGIQHADIFSAVYKHTALKYLHSVVFVHKLIEITILCFLNFSAPKMHNLQVVSCANVSVPYILSDEINTSSASANISKDIPLKLVKNNQ